MKSLRGQNLLVIGAHPDDEILGCGGLLAANSDGGGTSSILIVTEGSGAQNGGDQAEMDIRHQQLERACALVGSSKTDHWTYPDMQLDQVPHTELNAALQDYIEEGGYSVVLTHHPFDINRDHQVLYRSVAVACRPTPTSNVESLLTYHVNSSTEWGMGSTAERFAPNVYLDISSQLQRKLEALAIYEQEMRLYPHPRSIEAVQDRAKVFGSEVGVHAAEAFQLVYSRVR